MLGAFSLKSSRYCVLTKIVHNDGKVSVSRHLTLCMLGIFIIYSVIFLYFFCLVYFILFEIKSSKERLSTLIVSSAKPLHYSRSF